MRARIKYSFSLVFRSGHYRIPRKKSEKYENKQQFLLTLEINFPTICSSGTSQNRNGKPRRGSMITVLVVFSHFPSRIHGKGI